MSGSGFGGRKERRLPQWEKGHQARSRGAQWAVSLFADFLFECLKSSVALGKAGRLLHTLSPVLESLRSERGGGGGLSRALGALQTGPSALSAPLLRASPSFLWLRWSEVGCTGTPGKIMFANFLILSSTFWCSKQSGLVYTSRWDSCERWSRPDLVLWCGVRLIIQTRSVLRTACWYSGRILVKSTDD